MISAHRRSDERYEQRGNVPQGRVRGRKEVSSMEVSSLVFPSLDFLAFAEPFDAHSVSLLYPGYENQAQECNELTWTRSLANISSCNESESRRREGSQEKR